MIDFSKLSIANASKPSRIALLPPSIETRLARLIVKRRFTPDEGEDSGAPAHLTQMPLVHIHGEANQHPEGPVSGGETQQSNKGLNARTS